VAALKDSGMPTVCVCVCERERERERESGVRYKKPIHIFMRKFMHMCIYI